MANSTAHCERPSGFRSKPVPEPRRILYIEDDEDSREALKMFLEMHGCEVTGSPTAMDGLDALREGSFDLVITDFNLPDEDGAALLARAESEGLLHCAAVIVTGSYRIDAATSARVFVKPVDPRELLAMIEALPRA